MKDHELQDERNIKQSSWHKEDVELALDAETNALDTLGVDNGRAEDVVFDEAAADADDREAEERAAAADARALSGEDHD
ncbi:hypothetical protein [Gorillibacterium sp. sgz500922]|uniref:hypothetical protein n=1 Tax=Gorillibacterium sp. sgz500922 TaxID=3446694 RepID=UPI003F669649